MHDNVTNANNSKRRRKIPYEYNHQYRKIRPKLTEVYQSLSNLVKGLIVGMHNYRVFNIDKNIVP